MKVVKSACANVIAGTSWNMGLVPTIKLKRLRWRDSYNLILWFILNKEERRRSFNYKGRCRSKMLQSRTSLLLYDFLETPTLQTIFLLSQIAQFREALKYHHLFWTGRNSSFKYFHWKSRNNGAIVKNHSTIKAIKIMHQVGSRTNLSLLILLLASSDKTMI